MGPMAGARPGQQLLPIDWGALAPLRVRAAVVAEGLYAGSHRSARRGAGVEFGGQRPYVPGDDLRFLDRRSLMRHDRLMVREFETDTERAIWFLLDTSASMAFRGDNAPGSKLAYAALLAAALGKVATEGHDPIGLAWMGPAGGTREGTFSAGFGAATLERLFDALERAEAGGALADDLDGLDRQLTGFTRRARKGSVIVVFSDFLDVPDEVARRLAVLASERVLVAVQVLDPMEVDLGFRGRVRLREMEGRTVVTTDADRVRGEYVKRLAEHTERWRTSIESSGGRLVRARTDTDPVAALRSVLQAVSEVRR